MNEQGFKPIVKPQNKELPKTIPVNKENTYQNKKTPKYETIKSLPTWNIEPPLEIKRGNL